MSRLWAPPADVHHTHSRSGLAPEPPRIAIIDSERCEGERLRHRLRSDLPGVELEVVDDVDDVASPSPTASVDVALIRLGLAGCEGVQHAAKLVSRAPWLPIVFWTTGDGASVEMQVARALGLSRVLLEEDVLVWLPEAISLLARCARARREAHEAELALPAFPTGGVVGEVAAEPLRRAEQTFREAYLRSVLALSSTRYEAANKAGLPYTTLVSMIKKLGIEGEATSRARAQRANPTAFPFPTRRKNESSSPSVTNVRLQPFALRR